MIQEYNFEENGAKEKISRLEGSLWKITKGKTESNYFIRQENGYNLINNDIMCEQYFYCKSKSPREQ